MLKCWNRVSTWRCCWCCRLLEISHLVSHGCLPLFVIMQSTLHGSCSFFNDFKPIVDAMKGHLFIVVPTARVGYLSSLRWVMSIWSCFLVLPGKSPTTMMVLGISGLLLFFCNLLPERLVTKNIKKLFSQRTWFSWESYILFNQAWVFMYSYFFAVF